MSFRFISSTGPVDYMHTLFGRIYAGRGPRRGDINKEVAEAPLIGISPRSVRNR